MCLTKLLLKICKLSLKALTLQEITNNLFFYEEQTNESKI